GGRQLDCALPTALALPRVNRALHATDRGFDVKLVATSLPGKVSTGIMTDSPVAEEETTSRPVRRSRRALLGIATAGAAVGAVGTVTGAALPAYLAGPATQPAPAAAPSGRFAGKAVLITGGTSGIGRATAQAFAAEGARVSFCGRRVELGRQVEAEIRAAGGEAAYLPADVRIPEQLQHFVDETARRFGGLDIAFNNAGITKSAPLHEMRPEDFDDVHLTNERGVFLSIKYEVPHLLARGGGVIICTSSGSTRPGGTAYTASKRAIEGIVQAASLDYGTRGIRVNAILPGTTDTAFVSRTRCGRRSGTRGGRSTSAPWSGWPHRRRSRGRCSRWPATTSAT
ncbi:SDR family NAD(P)-dependent oxidoreductase, partial [Saccharopolyspora sp. NPDC050389]|uniref:SDR family NAD(P)-dependent oxidoreductase n=1 Tax=Saccharopolyspora sp. NPDC050389 TaxID=3155516 RepID=UPI0033E13420